jgi:hypothetical protein
VRCCRKTGLTSPKQSTNKRLPRFISSRRAQKTPDPSSGILNKELELGFASF